MLYCRTYGSCVNPPIIFLHGFLGCGLDYLPIIKNLQKEYCCFLIDLPGHGKSPYTPTLPAMQKCIESIYATTEQKPLLVGYSLGGRIALQISQILPLLGTIAFSAHIGLSCPLQKQKRLENDLLWKNRLLSLPKEEFISLWYAQAPFHSLQNKPRLLQKLHQERELSNPQELSLILEEMSLGKQDFLSHFPLPTCFAFGEEDIKYKDLYQTLPSSTLVLPIANAGHTVLLENPMACAQIVNSFLATY